MKIQNKRLGQCFCAEGSGQRRDAGVVFTVRHSLSVFLNEGHTVACSYDGQL